MPKGLEYLNFTVRMNRQIELGNVNLDEYNYLETGGTKLFDYLFGLEMSCTSELCIILFCKHFSKKIRQCGLSSATVISVQRYSDTCYMVKLAYFHYLMMLS